MGSNGVSGFPRPCDPREPCYCWRGYKGNECGPWKFHVEVTGATGSAVRFNGWWVVPFFEAEPIGLPSFCIYLLDAFPYRIEFDIGVFEDFLPPADQQIANLQFDLRDTFRGGVGSVFRTDPDVGDPILNPPIGWSPDGNLGTVNIYPVPWDRPAGPPWP